MAFGRFSLLLSAVLFGALGATFLFWPVSLARIADIRLVSATARVDIQSTYGGLNIGLAIFFTLCSRRDAFVRPGLIAQVLTLGGLALGRSFGLLTDDRPRLLTFVVLAAEVAGCALGWFAFRHIDRRVSPRLSSLPPR